MGGLLIVLLAAGIGQSGLFSSHEAAAEVGIDPLTTVAIAPQEVPFEVRRRSSVVSLKPETFVLASAGEERTCLAHATKYAVAQSGALRVEAGCLAVYPRLLQAMTWQRQDDGSIVFADQKGSAVVEFAEGDGLQYESVRPGEVLLSMSALAADNLAAN
ncbi:hypothetical protein ATN84_14645 [Paramesorhizobium deserti]|uniref:Alkaline proteinase inhibitor/ Outer membrane lipoprotein Omp19 domain-containing protein n=2 Tax=Paramesorhizobium deserti TaxID=1494590 RepID=A0A135HSH2_9HYPH|nr:hypothetical protein ATN84_14645 [Paramesorhizobium deserti]